MPTQPNKPYRGALFRIEQLPPFLTTTQRANLFFFSVRWRPRFDEFPERVGFFPDLPDHGFVFDGVFAEARELFPQRLDVRKTRLLVDALHCG